MGCGAEEFGAGSSVFIGRRRWWWLSRGVGADKGHTERLCFFPALLHRRLGIRLGVIRERRTSLMSIRCLHSWKLLIVKRRKRWHVTKAGRASQLWTKQQNSLEATQYLHRVAYIGDANAVAGYGRQAGQYVCTICMCLRSSTNPILPQTS